MLPDFPHGGYEILSLEFYLDRDDAVCAVQYLVGLGGEFLHLPDTEQARGLDVFILEPDQLRLDFKGSGIGMFKEG